MGSWQEQVSDWHTPNDCHCELCGRLLLGRTWQADYEGRTWTLCDPECENLLRTYRLAPSATAGSR